MELESDRYDVVVIGTGLTESIAAASLANAGKTVLHLDPNEYYGGDSASLTLDELVTWSDSRTISATQPEVSEAGPSISAYMRTERRRFSHATTSAMDPDLLARKRQYALSLNPAVLPSRGAMIATLIDSGVSNYVGFRLLDSVNIWEAHTGTDATMGRGPGKGKARRVPGSKEEVFKDTTISLVEKRRLMKFLMFVAGDFEGSDVMNGKEDTPLSDFLSLAFSLSPSLSQQITYGIAHCSSATEAALPALRRTQRYLKSIGRYGPSPFLVPQFGGAGEIAQGFCRACAVKGGTYVLGSQAEIQSLKVLDAEREPDTEQVELRLACHPRPITADRVITSRDHLPDGFLGGPAEAARASDDEATEAHAIAILSGLPEQLRPPLSDDEAHGDVQNAQDTAIILFPPEESESGGVGPVKGLIMGEGTGSCPAGQYILYLSCNAKPTSDPAKLLQPYLKALSPDPLFTAFYLSHGPATQPTITHARGSIDSEGAVVVLSPFFGREGMTEGLDWAAEQAESAFWAVLGGRDTTEVEGRTKKGWWTKTEEGDEESEETGT